MTLIPKAFMIFNKKGKQEVGRRVVTKNLSIEMSCRKLDHFCYPELTGKHKQIQEAAEIIFTLPNKLSVSRDVVFNSFTFFCRLNVLQIKQVWDFYV